MVKDQAVGPATSGALVFNMVVWAYGSNNPVVNRLAGTDYHPTLAWLTNNPRHR